MSEENDIADVFVCHTPLHVLIAQRIIEERKITKHCLVYLVENKSPKNLYYFSLLEKNALGSMFFVKTKSPIDFLMMIAPLLRLRTAAHGRIYVGNVKTFYSRFVIWFLGFSELNTFDDGIGNIKVDNQKGYFTDDNEIAMARAFFTVFDKSLLYKNIRKRIKTHYTIYRYPNVYDNTSYLQLFSDTVDKKEGAPRLNILLSNALAIEGIMSYEFERAFYDTLVRQYAITLVIRHPRNEGYTPCNGVEVSNSIQIAEHQILDLAKTHDVFVVSPFYSSVLVNLPSTIKKLNVVTLGVKGDRPELRTFHDILGIETADIHVVM